MRNLNIENQLIFCEKYGICPNELLLLEIILIAQEGDDPELVKNYFMTSPCARGSVKDSLQSLLIKGVINKTYKLPPIGTTLKLEEIPINKNLVKDFHKSSFEIGKELFETYPMFGIINGSTVGLRSVSKKFDTLEDFYRFYGKTIKWNKQTHDHIIELIEWAKENTNYICCTLANFVIDKKWLELESLKNGEIGNVNLDAIKLV